MLTNYKTVKQSIKRLEEQNGSAGQRRRKRYSRKNCWTCNAKWKNSTRSLGGIRDMKGLPDAIFVIDTGYQRAPWWKPKLGIPVIGVVDTNNSPEGIDYVIPGNDDSSRDPSVRPWHRRRRAGRPNARLSRKSSCRSCRAGSAE